MTIFKELTGMPYYIPVLTEVPASDLKQARMVFKPNRRTFKLAAHKDDPTSILYIWHMMSDGTAVNVDDDADHLTDPEREGVFEMRCIDLEYEFQNPM